MYSVCKETTNLIKDKTNNELIINTLQPKIEINA